MMTLMVSLSRIAIHVFVIPNAMRSYFLKAVESMLFENMWFGAVCPNVSRVGSHVRQPTILCVPMTIKRLANKDKAVLSTRNEYMLKLRSKLSEIIFVR